MASALRVHIGFVLVGLVGCDMSRIDPGGGAASKSTVTVRSATVAESAGKEAPADKVELVSGAPGELTGVITLEGQANKLPPRVAAGTSKVDPLICAKSGPIPDESFLIGTNGGIANVFVYLDKAPKGYSSAAEGKLTVDQRECTFLPHGVIARAGIPVELKNSENAAIAMVSHNVQISPKFNEPLNNNVGAGASLEVIFKKPEPAPFQGKCSLHPWMDFWILVVDHPFAAVTDQDGKFEIKNIPAGKHRFRIFHERAGANPFQTVEVEIKPGSVSTLPLKYKADKFKL